ncbi:MAG: tyrosine-type recombinase/integrase [Bacteroidetes bacterium]|nr:tyrosine-type recombinase/integrase [Bacteroidota bacterium]
MHLEDFLQYLAIEKRYSEHTVLAYKHDIESFLEYLKSSYEIEDVAIVNTLMIRGFVVELVEKGLQSKTVHRKISAIKSYYKFLLKSGDVKTYPANGVVLPKLKKRLPTFVEESKMNQLLDQPATSAEPLEKEDILAALHGDNFSSKRDKLILDLLYCTGMRLSELINLTMANVDLRDNTIRVLGKGRKERIIPISLSTSATIKEYLAYRLASESNYLIITDKAEQLYEQFVYRTVKKYLSQITTQEKKSPHVLRHTFATHMLNNGADLNAIKELLGHASLAATQVYTHNSIEKLKKVYNQAHPRA